MNNTKINSYIQFAVRSGKVLWGLDMVKSSKKIPYVIILDNTIGKNSKKQIERFASDFEIKLVEVEKDYLNNLLKRQNVKIIGILDESLSDAIINNLN